MARGVELGEVTQHNVRVLRLINQQVFPVSYNHRYVKLRGGGRKCYKKYENNHSEIASILKKTIF